MNEKTKKIQIEFFKLTGIALSHKTNRLKDRCIRKDRIFEPLAKKIFDNPRLLKLLLYQAEKWDKGENEEPVNALLGYLYYCAEDFEKAQTYFLKTTSENPKNLDNWLDLSFSLYHQGINKQNLAIKLFFNFDRCVYSVKKQKLTLGYLEKFLAKT